MNNTTNPLNPSYHSDENFVHENYLPPISYNDLSDEAVLEEIKKLKVELSNQVMILGHHYQQDDIIAFADATGDSLQLAKIAKNSQVENIIFCGVHFMAETADILTNANQRILLPDLNAGCSMADMAQIRHVQKAWDYIQLVCNDSTTSHEELMTPITYINCAANLKAFVGQHGGTICTSSNAKNVIKWALSKSQKLFFFPDQHLGRNTCFELGISLDKIVVYDPNKLHGGLTAEQIKFAQVILWYGYCSVHQGFKKEHIEHWKKTDPERIIIVHPECNFEVVQSSDLNGSTSFIVETLKTAATGSKFAVGTEINLINRLASQFTNISIVSLSPYQCLCTTMYRIRPRWLLQSLISIKEKQYINVIKVDEEIAHYSKIALNKMLELSL